MTNRTKFMLASAALGVLLLHALILLVVIPAVSGNLGQYYNGNQYADGYDEIASNLVAGNGYRFRPDTAETVQREPGYPLLLAGIFLLFGNNLAVVQTVNMLFAFAAAYVMTRIGRRLSKSWVVILGAPLLFLFHPGTLVAESRGGSEIVFSFLLTLFMLSILRAIESGQWWAYLLSGVVLGATLLIRSTPILFPFVLLSFLLIAHRKQYSLFAIGRNVAVMIAAMLLMLTPWIVRNYRLTKTFVPTSSVLGIAAQTGYYLCTHHPIGNLHIDREAAWERNRLAYEGGYSFKPGYYQYFYTTTDEVEFSQYLFKRVAGEYEKSPALFAKVIGINLLNFWCGGRTWKSVVMAAMIQIPLLYFALAGFILSARRGRLECAAPLGLLVLYVVAISVPILALARYSVPLVPFLAIFASVAAAAKFRSGPEAVLESPAQLNAS